MSNRVAIVLLGTAVLGGCPTGSVLDATRLYEIGEHLARSVCSGPPTSVTAVENRYEPGYIDRIEYRSCTKGHSEIYVGEIASDPQGLAMSVEILAPGAGLPPNIEIGEPINGALRALGKPANRSGDTVTYSISQDAESSLVISARAGRITSVRWSFSID